MDEFKPESISPTVLNDMRQAAEGAWGDDTRHESYIGHPQPSAGQCYVTAAWMKDRLGGHVGVKKGHYFWVSPDRSHVIDLTGDQFAYPPEDPALEGKPMDEDDEPWQYDPHQKTWRPGPVMYKRADHPLWKGFRVLSADRDYDKNPRVGLFKQRADALMRGQKASSYKHADLLGADPYPGSTPQKEEDWDIGAPFMHDFPDERPMSTDKEYKFVYANGQMHVSPMHEHDELASHAGIQSESNGPMAVGYVQVHQGHAMWAVETNIGLRGMSDVLKDYSETVGWAFDGMTDTQGKMHDDFGGPKKSMWYRVRHDGHMVMAEKPLPKGHRLTIEGKTAYTHTEVGPAREALQEWAKDFGYKLAEYPGGGNFEDKMKKRPNLDLHNMGNPDMEPEPDNPDLSLNGDLKCSTCGQHFNTSNELLLHRRDHDMETENRIEDGRFPWPGDFNQQTQNPGFGTVPVPNSGETIAHRIACMPVTAEDLFHYPDFDDWFTPAKFYGAYCAGQLIGYGWAHEGDGSARVSSVRPEASVALLQLMQLHNGNIHADAHDNNPNLLRQAGWINTSGTKFSAPAGQMPKDMIEAAIPFVWDIEGDKDNRMGKIAIGYAGEKTQDIPGKFTPGGIIEGYYEPGGKVIIISQTSVPWSVRQFGQLWYHQFPQMEISSVELERADGKTQKVASDSPDWYHSGMAKATATEIGQTVRTLALSDQAANHAYQALKFAGGQVYAVGGIVRDVERGGSPKDVDLMVAGLAPETVDHVLSQLPGRVDLTGKKFGVYRYRINGEEVEIALPRQDKYESGRRGEGVITVDHTLPIEKDLQRRDFTANSQAVSLDDGKLVDPYGGAKDVANNVLRTTHPDSFREDPTRLVRALVAHSRFGFNPDERTRHEMETNAHMLRNESPDALNKILDKLYASGNPAAAIRLAKDTGVLQHLYPEVHNTWDFDQRNPHHNLSLGEHALEVLDNVSRLTGDPDVRQAGLLHDIGKPASQWVDENGIGHYYRNQKGEGAMHESVGSQMAEDRMRQLNYPTARINRVKHLIQHHMFPAFNTAKGARKFLQNVGDQHADDLMNIREADQGGKGQGPDYFEKRTPVDTQRQLVDEARKQQAPTDLSNLAINGNDLLSLGVTPGPQIGNILRSLLDDVVQTPSDNNRDRLLELAQGYIQAQPAS